MTFYSRDLDLDLDPMTLIYETGLEILDMYLHAKIKLLGEGFRKLGITNRTDRQTEMRPNALSAAFRK